MSLNRSVGASGVANQKKSREWDMKVFVGLALSFALATAAGAAESPTHPDLSGVWWTPKKVAAVHPVGGGAIPFTPAGAAQYAKNKPVLREIDSKLPQLHAMKRCLPQGPPRVWGSGLPFQIFQRPEEVTIAYEQDHIRRFVYMDEKVDADTVDPGYMGNPTGHWDGKTLVIDSVAFKPTYLDNTGLPHGEKFKLTERLRKIDAKTLEVLATIDDSEMYSKPWTVRYTFALHPEEVIKDFICGVGIVQTRYGTEGGLLKLQHHGS